MDVSRRDEEKEAVFTCHAQGDWAHLHAVNGVSHDVYREVMLSGLDLTDTTVVLIILQVILVITKGSTGGFICFGASCAFFQPSIRDRATVPGCAVHGQR